MPAVFENPGYTVKEDTGPFRVSHFPWPPIGAPYKSQTLIEDVTNFEEALEFCREHFEGTWDLEPGDFSVWFNTAEPKEKVAICWYEKRKEDLVY